jgi:hypothetical protein
MSTHYRTLKKVTALELFDGRLEACGVREEIATNETTPESRCLTDGNNYVWAYIDGDGFLDSLTRYAPGGSPAKILCAIAEAFDTGIVSEHEPQYWGFDTQEEWDEWNQQWSREAENRFHNELLKYLRGEPNDIGPGTVGMIWAEIAKKLADEDPGLLLPTNKDKLRKEIETIYDREHAVKVTLGPADLAAAEMFITHEDDLPRA